jgi:transglutaminase-like putative cysteine protease
LSNSTNDIPGNFASSPSNYVSIDSSSYAPSATLLQVVHETRYDYAASVSLSQQKLHLTPRETEFQSYRSHYITVLPTPIELNPSLDYFGNACHYLSITEIHQQFVVRAESVVLLQARALPSFSMDWSEVVTQLKYKGQAISKQELLATQFLFASPHVVLSQELRDYASTSFVSGRTVVEAALDLTQRIYADFKFDPKATDISTPIQQVLKMRRGVCQDFAHLMIGCLRSLGLAARYVSGYILTNPPPGTPRLIGADASHAWVSVYCPLAGWIDFDPTNRCVVDRDHITLAWGRDFSDISLLRGVMLGSGDQVLKVAVTVSPISDTV